MHHIICDGTTISIIKKELNNYYENGIMDELEVHYSDYAIHVDNKKNNGSYEEQFKFYQEMFNENYEILSLPQKSKGMNNDEDDSIKKGSSMIRKIINKEQSRKIDDYVMNNSISKTSFFLSIYGYVLSKYSGQDNVYTSVISANRNSYYTENMIGMFVSTQPILLKYGENEIDFTKIIKDTMNKLIEIYNNQEISFSELISRLKLEKVNNTFVFQARGIMQENENSNIFDDDDGKDFYTVMDNYSDELMEGSNKEAKFDITFNIVEREEDYLILVEYNDNLYENCIISRIIDSYIEVIRNMESFGESIRSIEYIPENEKEKILKKFNQDVNRNECENYYFEKFQEMAEKYLEKDAIIYNELKYSYEELNKMTNSLAYYLRYNIGISKNDIIPVVCDRTPYYMISTLAISKAGGAFLPIDIKLPIDRIKFILQEVEPKIILYCTSSDVIESLNGGNYRLYNLKEHSYNEHQENLENINQPDDTCYVLFTSGTTGKPKGALVSHFNIYNYVRSFGKEENNYCIYQLFMKSNSINNVLIISNFAFDISHIEITISMVHGLTMVLADDITANNMNILSDYIIKKNVEYINTTLLDSNYLWKIIISRRH
eukprot:jgi/Orpsp1_1/1192748/evm.model.d7180000095597.1